MPIIKVEGVGKIKVPDEWDEAQIGAFVAKEFGGEDEVADPETSWFFERFGEAFGKSYKAAEEGLAIGQLVVANDKDFAMTLLESEFNQWQDSAGEGEEPPAFLSMAGMGEIFGGVTRDIGVGIGVGALASPVATPIGGLIAGAAATTSLQSLTAKGASFKDAYIQIRAKQLERGVDDKEAAYETARKISNADAAYAAAETVVSTAAPGFGKVGTRAITKVVGKAGGSVMSRAAVDVTGKAISELGVDAVAGGVGSIASDLTAEALGGEQGIERGNIWENAAKAAVAEPLVGLAPSLIRTRARHKEFKKQEKFLDDALERGRQYKSDQQEIEAQTDIIVKRGLEQEREQARRLKEGWIPPADRAKIEGESRVVQPGFVGPIRPTKETPIIQGSKPISVEGRLVLPPDVRNVPPPGMGIPVDESFMATGEGVSPILDERGNIMLPSTHPLGGDPRGTEARAMQAQGARASAAFSRIGHAKLGDAMTWLDNRIAQLESLRERGVKFPKKEFPIEEGQLELQFGWPTDGPALDSLGFDENISRVLNPNFDLSTPAPGLNLDSELERLSHLRGLFEARQAEIKFAEKEAEVTGIKVTDHREPSHILLDVELDIPGKKAISTFEKAGSINMTTPDAPSKGLWESKGQAITSADTSINKTKLPATFTKPWVVFPKGGVNVDIGGGRFDNATEHLAKKGVTNHTYDPYNRSQEHNETVVDAVAGGKTDTATVNNVLNVIKEPQARSQVIAQAADAVKPEGVAYFKIYEGSKSGKGSSPKSKPDNWQENRKTESYTDEVKAHFQDVQRRGDILIAKDPIKTAPATPKREARAEGVEENLEQQKAQEAKNEFIAAVKEIGDPTKMGMGVDPTPIWKAFKGLVKLAYYHGARGAKSAAEFAKRAGLNLTAAVKKAWDVYKSKRAIQPKDMGSPVIAHLSGYDKTMTAEGQAKQATIDRIEVILHPNMGSAAVRRLGDKFIGLDNLQKYYAEGREIPDTNNSYQAQQLGDGVLGRKNADFRDEIRGIIEQMQEMNLPFENVELYLYALHAQERNEHIAKINKKFPDGGSGMTEADRVEVLQIIRDSGKQEQYDKIVSQIYAINKRTLQIQLDGGLITQQDFDNLSNYYKNYVPLKGHHDSDPFSQKSGNHIPITGEIKGRDNEYALGHGERSTDILAHVFEQHSTAVNRAERNKVYQTLRSWVEANPDNEVIEIATTENAPLEPKRTPAKMEKVDGVDYIVEEATVKDVIKPAWQNDKNIVALRVNGENVYLRVKHDELAKNLKEMGTATLGEFPKLFAGFMRWRAVSNTMLNVDFPLGNFIRDLETAGINLGAEENAFALQKATMKNVKPAFKAMWKLERGKPVESKMERMAKLMRDNGGKMEYASLNNLEHNIRMIEEYDALVNPKKYTITAAWYDKKTKGRKKAQNMVKAARLRLHSKARIVTEQKMVRGAFNILKDANAAMENATRLAVFTALMDSGKATPKQAAFMARNITVNFTKKGEWGTNLNTAYLFYNASFGGNLRIFQAAKSPRVQKILMGIMALGTFENMFNQMVGEEDEDGYTDYDKINEYSKQSNILIPADWMGELLGRTFGRQHEDQNGNLLDGKFITIPTAYGYNAVHYAGKQITAVIPALGGKKSIGDAIGDIFTTAMNAFNPIGGGGDILRSVIPEVGKPVLDISRNLDWKNDRIAPDPNPFAKFEKPDSQMYWSTASTWGVNTAQTLNRITGGSPEDAGIIDVSPETLDYAVQFIAGGMGNSISRVVDAPFKLAKGDLQLEDIPVIRRFQEDPSPYFEMENHKDLRDLVYKAEAGKKRLLREKVGPRALKEFKKDNAVAFQMLVRVKSTDASLKKYNNKLKIVEASTTFSRAEKKKKSEKLNHEKRLLLRKTQKLFLDKVNEE